MKNYKKIPLTQVLEELLAKAKGGSTKLGEIFQLLKGRGNPILLIIIGIPFCLPVQIPGLSTPFGVVLAIVGLRIAFGKAIWWPKRIQDKEVSYEVLEKIVNKAITLSTKMQRFVYPRWVFITEIPILHIMHGLVVVSLALLLALPLPIPLTNMLASFPIVFMGLGLMEEDGLMVVLAYLLTVICFVYFFAVLIYGGEELYTYLKFTVITVP